MDKLNYYKIGQRIRKYRKALNLSQDVLAEKVSISTTHLSHIETGNTKLSLSVFVDIANALSVQTDQLLFDTPSNNSILINDILDLLNSCSSQELFILKDILKVSKSSLNKYL